VSFGFNVPIDLRTIKPNADAGSTTSFVHGHTTCQVSFEYAKTEVPPILKQYECVITSFKRDTSNELYQVTAMLCKVPRGIKTIGKKLKNFEITVNNNMQPIEHRPVPEYSFSYLPTKVKCSYCSHKFKHTELKDNCCMIGDEEHYFTDLCPKCLEADCVILQYEPIDEAIARKRLQCPGSI